MGKQSAWEEEGWGMRTWGWSRPGLLLQCSKGTNSPGKNGQWKEPCSGARDAYIVTPGLKLLGW